MIIYSVAYIVVSIAVYYIAMFGARVGKYSELVANSCHETVVAQKGYNII
jgi:hypothetical protein